METFQIESCVGGHHIYNLESTCDYIMISKDHLDSIHENFQPYGIELEP